MKMTTNEMHVPIMYVELEDLHPNEFQNDGWVDSTYVKNITIKLNKSTAHTATKNLKSGDIFESKVKLLQAITDWSIKRRVSFALVITNKSSYTTVSASIKEKDNVGRNVCL